MNQVGRSQFSEKGERVGAGIDRLLEDLLRDPVVVGDPRLAQGQANAEKGRCPGQLMGQEGH